KEDEKEAKAQRGAHIGGPTPPADQPSRHTIEIRGPREPRGDSTLRSAYSRHSVKALVKSQAEPGLWLQDVPQPKPGPGEVLIRVLRTGICGTDLHIDSWNEWAQHTIHPTLVVGHEFVGEVVVLGEGVETVFHGDIVRVAGQRAH